MHYVVLLAAHHRERMRDRDKKNALRDTERRLERANHRGKRDMYVINYIKETKRKQSSPPLNIHTGKLGTQ